MTTASQHTLGKEQVRLYHRQGWLGPFTLISEAEMAAVRAAIDREILGPGRAQGLAERDYFHNRPELGERNSELGRRRGWRKGSTSTTAISTTAASTSC